MPVAPLEKEAEHPADDAHDNGPHKRISKSAHGKPGNKASSNREDDRVNYQNEEAKRRDDEGKTEQKDYRPHQSVDNPEEQRRPCQRAPA